MRLKLSSAPLTLGLWNIQLIIMKSSMNDLEIIVRCTMY